MLTTGIALSPEEWRALENQHHERADALTAGRRARAARGQTHPVDDFLYTYYSYKPAVLRRWHPVTARDCGMLRPNRARSGGGTPPNGMTSWSTRPPSWPRRV